MIHPRRAMAVLLFPAVLLFGACDPNTVLSTVRDRYGVELTIEQATSVSENLKRREDANAPTPMSPGEVELVIREVFAGTGVVDQAVRVARCESELDWDADNPKSTATGPFQLIALHWRGIFNPLNVRANAKKARALWAGSGWRPWSESRRCWGR